jgi:hypothetical protein
LFPNWAGPVRLAAGGMLAPDVNITRLRRVGKNQADRMCYRSYRHRVPPCPWPHPCQRT